MRPPSTLPPTIRLVRLEAARRFLTSERGVGYYTHHLRDGARSGNPTSSDTRSGWWSALEDRIGWRLRPPQPPAESDDDAADVVSERLSAIELGIERQCRDCERQLAWQSV